MSLIRSFFMNRLPRNVLDDVLWAYRGERFSDRAEFTRTVGEYQLRIRGEDVWRPAEIVLPRYSDLVGLTRRQCTG